MKSSKEMADRVFEIRNAYLEKKKIKKRRLKKIAYVCSTLCVFSIIISGAYNLNSGEIPHLIKTNETSIVDITTIYEDSATNTLPTESNDDNLHIKDFVEIDTDVSSDIIERETESEEKQQSNEVEDINISEQTSSSIIDDYIESGVSDTTEEITNIELPTEDTNSEVIGEIEGNELEEDTFATYSLSDLYKMFPEFEYGKKYMCQECVIEESQLEIAIDDIIINGYDYLSQTEISANVTVYCFQGSDENNEIAVMFKGRHDYIIYNFAE